MKTLNQVKLNYVLYNTSYILIIITKNTIVINIKGNLTAYPMTKTWCENKI